MSIFDQSAALDEPIRILFEMRRYGARSYLEDVIKYRPHDAPYNDDSESRALSKSRHFGQLSFPLNKSIVNNESSDSAHAEFSVEAVFEVAQDILRLKFRSMSSLLHQIQDSEWPYYRRFPYVPYYFLFMCGFAWAQALVAYSNEETGMVDSYVHYLRSSGQANGIPNIVLRSILNAGVYSRHNKLRLALLAGLGISTVWSICRAWRLGTIIWCRYSLEALIKKFEAGKLDERDKGALDSFKWNMLWYINIMF